MEYELQIQYDEANEDKIKIGSNSDNEWLDLGILIEALGTMMAINRKKRNMGKAEMFDYVKDYLGKVAMDFDKSESLNN